MPTAKRTKSAKKKKNVFKSIIFGIIILTLLFLIDSQIRPIVTSSSSYFARQYSITQINAAVQSALASEDISYESLVTLQTDDLGNVKSIQTNSKEIARIHTMVTSNINQAFSELQSAELSIPIGSLSGVIWLSGLGPYVSIKIIPHGVANTEIISTFSEAGINQTLHQLKLHITADMTVLVPCYPTTVRIESEYLLAESVIVGETPKYYSNSISGITQTSDSNKYNSSFFLEEKESTQ